MACNSCENGFNSVQTLLVSINRVGNTATLFITNQSRNVVLIQRILLCVQNPGGGGFTLYLRAPPNGISWTYPIPFLEQNTGANYYTLTGLVPGAIVQAQAEYTEYECRARSCAM